MPRELPRIWIITNPEHEAGMIAPLERALEGPARGRIGVQLRAKHASDRELIALGHRLRTMTASAGGPLVINQRPDVAQLVGADGVHLPETGLPIADIRKNWPLLQMIGVSRHDRAGLVAAQADGATYALLGPVFEVPLKNAPLGVEGFGRAITGLRMPVFALGGIGPNDAEALIDAGAEGVAVRRAVYDAAEPGPMLDAFLDRLDKDHTNVE